MPPLPCSSICLPAARAISHDCVTLASITSRNVSGCLIDDLRRPCSCPRRPPGCRRGRTVLTAAATIRRNCSAELGRIATLSTLPPQRLAFGGDLLQFVGIAGRKHDIGAGAGQHLRGERAERARRAGDDRGLAADVEQRERVLQKVFGHGSTHLARCAPSPRLRGEGWGQGPAWSEWQFAPTRLALRARHPLPAGRGEAKRP